MIINSFEAQFQTAQYAIHYLADTQVIIKVSGHQHWWLAGGYDLEICHF